ncbi:uncharacterized protein Dtd [Halyomorpha halys]|uniref:uncharacterized protein Dtd n=1 Tax=Halyomorpha halys TaxID=286706 RepID=UPI0006D4E37D|nr:uncharacterized protein LOC106689724 [Halyomorpha halys]
MRVVIQRVLSANASADGKIISSIGKGLCVLVGISRNDTKSDIEYIVKKILNSKLFGDSSGKLWSKSVKDCGGEILCLSQVTLYNTFKGNKLDFHHAMASDKGKEFYNQFLEHIRAEYKPELVKEGIFGAHLVISLQNDGPVTITVDSPNSLGKKEKMELDLCSSQTASVKQDSTSSQTCLVKQDSAYSQTNQSFGDNNLNCPCSQVENIADKVKQGSASSQTCLVKQDHSSSQTRLVKQDSTSSQTHLIMQDIISSQTIKENEISEDTSSASQDSKFSQTTSILQSNMSSQTHLVKQDSVSSQTCSRLQEGIPNAATAQTTA